MGNRVRFKSLDSLRGICAIAVVFFHFPILGSIRAFPPFAHGYLFVDFFFVLSGFVIATAWEPRLVDGGAIWRFLLRRFGRLWPLHVAILSAFVAVSLIEGDLGHDERHSVPAIFTNLALIHGLGMHTDLTWNGPSWSISVEAALYIIFAFLAPLPWRVWVFGGLVVSGLVILSFWAPDGMASTFDFGIYRGFAGFFTGVLLTRCRPRRLGVWGEIACVTMVVIFVSLNQMTILAPAVFGITVYVFAHSNGLISRILEGTPFRQLGEWSYSTYMVHSAVVAVIWKLGPMVGLTSNRYYLVSPSEGLTAAIALGYLIAVVGISALTYSLIERPGRDFFNRLAASQPATLASR